MDEEYRSADDALEEARTGSNPLGVEPLEEDNDSPAEPADESQADMPLDYPQTDTNIDSAEEYDEGREGAVGYQGDQSN